MIFYIIISEKQCIKKLIKIQNVLHKIYENNETTISMHTNDITAHCRSNNYLKMDSTVVLFYLLTKILQLRKNLRYYNLNIAQN